MPHIRHPLLRFLAINLAIGISMAMLMVGGLLALNPLNLRHLIFADRDAAAALGLLLFGFLITFGSAAMGTAVMALGAPREPGGGGGKPVKAPVEAIALAHKSRA